MSRKITTSTEPTTDQQVTTALLAQVYNVLNPIATRVSKTYTHDLDLYTLCRLTNALGQLLEHQRTLLAGKSYNEEQEAASLGNIRRDLDKLIHLRRCPGDLLGNDDESKMLRHELGIVSWYDVFILGRTQSLLRGVVGRDVVAKVEQQFKSLGMKW